MTRENGNSTAAARPEGALRPFGLRDKIAYGMGDFGCNMSFALNSYLMLFYTQYIGLSLEVWGVIILALKIWDGINDPIMGGLMDSLKAGKRGKFKTYIFYGSFVLAVSGAMCFLPIPAAPMPVKILVCVLGYLLWDMTYTLVNVPYGAMNAAITAKPTERAQLSTYRTAGGFIATMLVMVFLPMLCYDSENNLLGGRLFVMALIMGGLGLLSLQAMLRGVTERVTPRESDKPKEKYNYFRALKGFFTNRAAVGVTLAAMMGLLMSSGITSGNAILFQTFFQDSQIMGILSLVTMVPMFVLMPFTKRIVARFGKKAASAGPMVLGLVATALMMVLPISPETGMPLWVALAVIAGASSAIFNMVGWAMVADCIDYQELRTGRREEGTVYATYSLGRKLAQGFGASIISFLLILTGYNAATGAQQAAGVPNNIRILIGAIQFVCTLLSFLVLVFVYNLNKKTVNEMEQKLGHDNTEKRAEE